MWENRKKLLTKNDLKHLVKNAGCTTKEAFQRTIDAHAEWRSNTPDIEPCWECRFIADKLRMGSLI